MPVSPGASFVDVAVHEHNVCSGGSHSVLGHSFSLETDLLIPPGTDMGGLRSPGMKAKRFHYCFVGQPKSHLGNDRCQQ
jgi:hypothetical protein